jgi:hypothetical protein
MNSSNSVANCILPRLRNRLVAPRSFEGCRVGYGRQNQVPATTSKYRSAWCRGSRYPQVYVALVPTANCWHVPAHLRFGAWNECPQSEEHVALMRFWQQNFGAEVVGITSDVVEMLVEFPPSNKVDALKLAKQQYLYCQDIVDQGTQTLEVLAAGLLGGTSWFFWWD